MNFNLNPIGICAAEITGLDCARPLADDVEAIKKVYLAYPVLIFRDQALSAPQLATFSRHFGALEGYGTPPGTADGAKPQVAALHQIKTRETPDQNLYVSPEDPDILIMTNKTRPELAHVGIIDNAEMWHSDGSHKPEPYQSIIVHVVRNPASGGNTEFCDMRAVYETFTPHIRAVLDGRTAVHHWSKSRNPRFADALDPAARVEGERIAQMIPEMRQPLVRTHPETGRRSLYLSPRFTLRIDGMPVEYSDSLLNAIFALADEPRFHYRHEWREKDLMIWDNRCLNHRVRSYPAHDIRTRLRATVSGDRPFFRA